MPIPRYLNDIAYSEKNEKNFSTFNLKCKCGNILFDLYENYLSKEEKEICRPYYEALNHLFKGGYGSSCTVDENGKLHHWKHLSFNPDGLKEEVFIPPAPACAHIHSFKVKCSECANEYTIFDNRYHGYDGKFCSETNDEEKKYIPHYKKKSRRDNSPVRICIKVEYDLDENTDMDCSPEDYTEAFTWLVIYTIDNDGKKRKVVDWETA